MWGAFGEWLLHAPTPWDILASIGAFGAWVVNALDRRDRKSDLKPIFEPSATANLKGTVGIFVKVKNNYPHSIAVVEARLLSPRGTVSSDETLDHGRITGWAPSTSRKCQLNFTLQAGGNDANHWPNGSIYAWGDEGNLRFAAMVDETFSGSLKIALKIRELHARRREKTYKMTIPLNS